MNSAIQKRLPRSQRKFIRQEKARIRREILGFKKQEEMIQQLYKRFRKKVITPVSIIKTKKKATQTP